MPLFRMARERLGFAGELLLVCWLLLLIIGGLVLSLVALTGSVRTAHCVNATLGARQIPTSEFYRTTDEFAKKLDGYFKDALREPTDAGKIAAFQRMGLSTHEWAIGVHEATVNAAKHPYGHC